MSISLAVDLERSLLIATAVGDLSLAELQDFIRTARSGERREWPLLFDATWATTAINAVEIRALSSLVGSAIRTEGARAPVAVAAADDVVFGMMRMYQAQCEGEGFDGIGVFRTREAAETWLGSRIGQQPIQ
jgi:hypothetical protein